MVVISNGKVDIEVPEDKAFHYCLSMGYHIKGDPEELPEPVIPEPRKPRGRPRKAD